MKEIIHDFTDGTEHITVREKPEPRETHNEWLHSLKEGDYRCACGCCANPQKPIWGTVFGQKAKWAGCDYCIGTAVGPPYIYHSYWRAGQ